MQLPAYINDLLYRYECVIVPGFGALLTQYHSAKIDAATNVFYPPGKTLSFNRQLQTNDGLLANYLASVEKCSYETALQKIRNFTGKLSLKLAEGEKISLGNIGEFHLNDEKSVQFVPFKKQNFSAASFGMTSLVAPKIEREIYKETAVALEEKVPVYLTSEKRETKTYLKYAAMALIAISVTGFGGLKIYEGNVQNQNFAEKQKADSLVENKIQEATFAIENPLPVLNLTLAKQTGRYHVIAGAFRIKSNADKKIQQLLVKGYSAKMIGINKYGLHQVAYSSHENQNEALQSLRTMRRIENQDAWLLVQDLRD